MVSRLSSSLSNRGIQAVSRELFGRNKEFRIIEEMLDSALAGEGASALVEGIIGTGKTTLLRWSEGQARQRGMLVLSATAAPTERRFSMGIVHQLFSCLGNAGVSSTPPGQGASRHPAPVDPQYLQLSDLYKVMSTTSERIPILVTVDCIQCVDRDSLLWLGFLLRRIENIRVVLLASQRRGEPASDQHLLVEFMESIRPDRHLHLEDLSPSTASRLVDALGSCVPGPAETLIADSGGNPYLLTQQILAAPSAEQSGDGDRRDSGADLPIRLRAVKDRVLCLLRRLDLDGLRVAHAASVVGGSAMNAELIGELCSLSVEDASRSLEQLAECGILHPTSLAFRHPVIARLLYFDIPRSHRAVLHQQTARCLHNRRFASADITPHLVRAATLDEPWMAGLLLDAAEELLPRDAPTALQHIETVERHGVPEQSASRIAELRVRALLELDLPGSVPAQYALLGLSSGHRELAARAHRLADTLIRLGRPQEARKVLNGAQSGRDEGAAAAARLSRHLAHICMDDGACADAPRGLERLESVMLRRIGNGDSASAARRLCRMCLATPRTPYGSPSWYYALLGLIWAGDFDEAQSHIDAEVRLAVKEGAVTRLAEARSVRALLHMHRGLLTEAGHDARLALTALRRIGADAHHMGALARSVLIDVAVEKDQLAGAGELLDVQVPSAGQPTAWWHLHLAHSAARALGRLGHTRQALTLVTYCEQELGRRGISNPAVLPWRSTKALICAGLGNLPDARRLAQREADLALRWGAPFAQGRALLALAAVSPVGDVLRLARRAVDLLDVKEAPLLYAQSLYATGHAYQQSGSTVRARELLHRANEVSIALGADALVELVQKALRDAGGRPDPRKASAEALLTRSERQVAKLASQGMSNRDIARLLQVSLRNIESHLTHCYRKLRISGRGELSRFLVAEDGAAGSTLLRPHSAAGYHSHPQPA
ncbi:helix-turn-helix transcriptional regulator [Streptomyces parvus]|uniref:helix-turn-helix transcriptional regulator n=1 Tax=Streptomyces parvus TaxID=66428 RepID=UPI0027E4FB72|nr:BREX system ATP-binding domain-containing protein [Streptomyces parvus]